MTILRCAFHSTGNGLSRSSNCSSGGCSPFSIASTRSGASRVTAGLSTLERECAEQGEDYLEIIQQRARERKEMKLLELDADPDVAIEKTPE
jgi:hypothetical protein